MENLLKKEEAGGMREIYPYFRPQPGSLEDLKLPEGFLSQLLLKHCFYLPLFAAKDLADRLKVKMSIVAGIIDKLVKEKCLDNKGAFNGDGKSNFFGLGNRYALTEEGKRRAGQLLEYDKYVGPAPVDLQDYWDQVKIQSVQVSDISMGQLERTFKDLVISPGLLEHLGPALISGNALFLYGPSGNGKTTIATRLVKIWEDAVLIPYALYVDGHVIRVFDEINHHPVDIPETTNGNGGNGNGANGNGANGTVSGDPRWLLCHRPAIVAGGELDRTMLEMTFNPDLKYYEAPLQLKANNGIFVVDDFGRQQVPPQVLLDRWIIPLENRRDYLYLNTGQKFAVPFDQLLVFATNLDPNDLLDQAFLRRIRAKVKVRKAEQSQYLEIFQRVCKQHCLAFHEKTVNHLLAQYESNGWPMAACQPRDLVVSILDYCRFHKLTPALSQENIDRACSTYFVDC